jgi:DNA-binding NarL/FixJ family response regulator
MNCKAMKTILIFTEDRLKADTLDKLLRIDGFASIGKSTSLESFIVKQPDVVITDQIVNAFLFPKIRFVLMIDRFDTHVIAAGLKAFYWGYVLSDDGLQGLYDCVRSVQKGEKFFSPAVTAMLRKSGVAVHDEKVIKTLAQLSVREREVLKMISTGLSGDVIASRLNISYRTFINHKSNMTLKLNLVSNRNLLPFAISVHDYL